MPRRVSYLPAGMFFGIRCSRRERSLCRRGRFVEARSLFPVFYTTVEAQAPAAAE